MEVNQVMSEGLVVQGINVGFIMVIVLFGLISARRGISNRVEVLVSMIVGITFLPVIATALRNGIFGNERVNSLLDPLAERILEWGMERSTNEGYIFGFYVENLQERGMEVVAGALVLVLVKIGIFVMAIILFRVLVPLFSKIIRTITFQDTKPFYWLDKLLGFIYGVCMVLLPVWVISVLSSFFPDFPLVNQGVDLLTQIPVIDFLFRYNPLSIILGRGSAS